MNDHSSHNHSPHDHSSHNHSPQDHSSEKNHYRLKNHIRVVTSAALFDGHDAAINIMRRILQDMGVEVIHLGHNRSVAEVVKAALQEGAQGIAVSSYQGGHIEYFKYMKDLLRAHGADYVKIFGGGGGVIIHEEKKELEDYGIDQIFHPDDGRRLGLEGMIETIVKACDFKISKEAEAFDSTKEKIHDLGNLPHRDLGLLVDQVELGMDLSKWNSEVKRKWSEFSKSSKSPESPESSKSPDLLSLPSLLNLLSLPSLPNLLSLPSLLSLPNL